jgi:diguanylate cyclase (GGDEF)-like protein/PAS domain S-box-containing protein
MGEVEPLNILLVEDSPDDATLLERQLRKDGMAVLVHRVDSANALRQALAAGGWDIVLCDYAMPGFDGAHALEIVREQGTDLPLIYVSGQMGEDVAVGAMRAGAADYITKGSLKRLSPAIQREVREARTRHTARALEADRRKTEAQLADILRNAADAIISVDEAQRITLFNRGAEAIFGYTAAEAIGQPLSVLLPARFADTHRDHVQRFAAGHAQTRHMGERSQVYGRRRDGSEFPAEATISKQRAGGEWVFTVFLRDITERKAQEERIRMLGHYDALTGLPNRSLFNDRLRQTLLEAGRFGRQAALIVLNLDRFRAVNDTLGHEVGDQLLKAVTARLPKAVQPWDTVARLGGDEFAVLLPQVEHPETAGRAAQALLGTLGEPLWIDGRELYTTASAGIAVYPQDGREPDTLLAAAETALARAKEHGGTYQFHTGELTARAQENLRLEHALRRALERREFELHYQPQIELASGLVVGFEALLRWSHPELGTVPPTRFVPVLESTGLIVPVGEWVFETALRQLKTWQQREYLGLRMAVNLSPRQFADPRLVDVIRETARRARIGMQHVEIEITEALLVQEGSAAVHALGGLRSLGCTVTVDDFGVGYSSLSYLRRLPVTQLKIDRSFVREIEDPDREAQLVNAIIAMARGLRMTVVAEGVEHPHQLTYLRRQKCDLAQGFLFSPAVPAAQAQEVLAREVQSRYGSMLRR